MALNPDRTTVGAVLQEARPYAQQILQYLMNEGLEPPVALATLRIVRAAILQDCRERVTPELMKDLERDLKSLEGTIDDSGVFGFGAPAGAVTSPGGSA